MTKIHERHTSADKTLNVLSVKIIQSEKWKEKGIENTHEFSFKYQWDSIKHTSICILRAAKEKETDKIIEG